MLARLLSRRHAVFAVLATLAERLLEPTEARADLWGGDVAVLSGILTQAIATVVNLANLLQTVQQELSATQTMLSTLDGQSFEAVLGIVNDATFSLSALTANVSSIGYTLGSVNSQFQKLYAGSYANVPLSQFDAMYGQWEGEILSSAEVAARSQATLSSLQNNATEAAAILAGSRASDGEVAQMQSVVQMLGLVQSQNNSVLQSLETTGRVLTATAAKDAAERQLAREKKRRHLAGYTSRGPSVPPMAMP